MKLFEKNELKHLGGFYLSEFLLASFMIWPAFGVFFLRDIGLSMTHIGLLFSLTFLVTLALEVPTGSIADTYGRKASFLIGAVIQSISALIPFFFESFSFLIVAFVGIGIGSAFLSGSKEAWVVDNLKANRLKKMTSSYFTKTHSVLNAGLIFSGLIGAFLVKTYGLKVIWPVSAFAILLMGIVLLFIKEHAGYRSKTRKSPYRQMKISLKYARKHHSIFKLILIMFFLFAWTIFSGDWMWQIFLENKGMEPYLFGYIFSIGAALGVFVPLLAHRIVKKFRSERNYLISVLILALPVYLLVSLVTSWEIGAVLFLISLAFFDAYMPIDQNFYQKFLPSQKRATLGSARNMAGSMASIIFFPIAGLVADAITAQWTIVLSVVLAVPLILLYRSLPKRR